MVFRKINTILLTLGINVIRLARTAVGLPKFVTDVILFDFKRSKKLGFRLENWRPIFGEHLMSSGDAKGHYFYMDNIVSNWLYDTPTREHLDVGSRLDGFISSVCVFRKVTYIDIRENNIQLSNFKSVVGDIMNEEFVCRLPKYDSVSCLHTLEHFGLGRYGDNIDPAGHLKGLKNISKIVNKGGYLYLAVPMGEQRVEFNAHRVFFANTIPELLTNFTLEKFAYVDDAGFPHYPGVDTISKKQCYNQRLGCAIYQFRKND